MLAAAAPRRYKGALPAERQHERRQALIEAGIAVYGEIGYRSATVKAVCAAAGLTERYFYESFENSEALLSASYARVSHNVALAMAQSFDQEAGSADAKVDKALRTLFEMVQRSPRSARVFLIEIGGVSAALDDDIRRAHLSAAPFVVPELVAGPEQDIEPELLVAGVVGGVFQIAIRWVQTGYAQSIDDVVATAALLCRGTAKAWAVQRRD